ncbi:MAG: hypothetical protein ACJA0E_000188 [Bermanella sp.]|jgi:hypothetical protein
MNNASELDLKPVNVFSRGSLKLTYDALRQINPMLALQVRNITQGQPLPKNRSDADNKHADYFTVDLDSFQVRAVVEGLMACSDNKDNRGLAIMAKSLLQDWKNLVHKMINELP